MAKVGYELFDFFRDKKFSDLNINVRSGDNFITIPSHKIILMQNSEVMLHTIENTQETSEIDIDITGTGTIEEFLFILRSVYNLGNGLSGINTYDNYSSYNINLVSYFGFFPLYNFLFTNPFTGIALNIKHINSSTTRSIFNPILFTANGKFSDEDELKIVFSIKNSTIISYKSTNAENFVKFAKFINFFPGKHFESHEKRYGDILVDKHISININTRKFVSFLIEIKAFNPSDKFYHIIKNFSKDGLTSHFDEVSLESSSAAGAASASILVAETEGADIVPSLFRPTSNRMQRSRWFEDKVREVRSNLSSDRESITKLHRKWNSHREAGKVLDVSSYPQNVDNVTWIDNSKSSRTTLIQYPDRPIVSNNENAIIATLVDLDLPIYPEDLEDWIYERDKID